MWLFYYKYIVKSQMFYKSIYKVWRVVGTLVTTNVVHHCQIVLKQILLNNSLRFLKYSKYFILMYFSILNDVKLIFTWESRIPSK